MPMQTLRRPLAVCDCVGDELIFKISVPTNRYGTIHDGRLFEQSGGNFREHDLIVANPPTLARTAYQFQIPGLVEPGKIPRRGQSLLEFTLTPLLDIRVLDIDLTCHSNGKRF